MRAPRTRLPIVVAVLALVGMPSAAHAACAAPEGAKDAIDLAADAATVFIGVARAGDTAQGGDALVTPAVFDVQYRLAGKRRGAAEQVTTAVLSPTSMVSEGIMPRAGEQWMLTGVVDTNGRLATSLCDPLNRRIDTTKAPVVSSNGTTVTPALADLRGRPVIASATAPKLPRRATSFRAPGSSLARLVHRGKITKLRKAAGAWRVGSTRPGDRIFWLDRNGLWAVRVG